MTAQIGDYIIYNREKRVMACTPGIPQNHPRIIQVAWDEINLPEEDMIIGSTACWRHYIATWEIIGDRVYLVGVKGALEILGDQPIPADWLTGVLRITQGECLEYIHMGFASVYETVLHISVENGLVVKTRVIDNRKKSRPI